MAGSAVLTLAPTFVLAAHALPPASTPRLVPIKLADGLSVSAPTSATLGSGTVGSTLTGQLGTVSVAGSGTLGWTASVSISSPFTVSQDGQSATFPAERIRYWSGPATDTSGGLGLTCIPGQLTSALAQSLDVERTAFSCTLGVIGSSSASWDPRLVVQTQSGDFAGTYTGTITHSVL